MADGYEPRGTDKSVANADKTCDTPNGELATPLTSLYSHLEYIPSMSKILHTPSGHIASAGTLQIQGKKADKVKLRLLNLYRKCLDEDINNSSKG